MIFCSKNEEICQSQYILWQRIYKIEGILTLYYTKLLVNKKNWTSPIAQLFSCRNCDRKKLIGDSWLTIFSVFCWNFQKHILKRKHLYCAMKFSALCSLLNVERYTNIWSGIASIHYMDQCWHGPSVRFGFIKHCCVAIIATDFDMIDFSFCATQLKYSITVSTLINDLMVRTMIDRSYISPPLTIVSFFTKQR